MEKIISTTKADIGVSIIESETNNIIDINGGKLYPMLSTVKFPIALAALNRVEKGELSIKQQLLITKEELLENTWSPFKEKYPEGNVSISLENALMWMMVYSDNNMTDILLRLIGGTESVEKFIDNENFVIKNNEEDMHKDWDSQFVNHASPNAYSALLKTFSEGKILNEEHTKWLYQSMVSSNTGTKRLKGKLPNVIIAQRAGTSFTSEAGVTGAINNVGIMELPNNRKVYISVFIHNTSEGFEKGEEMIADIAKATYDYYTKK
ncbi:MAG: class A beta-lactamase [Chitinophagales bacterium]